MFLLRKQMTRYLTNIEIIIINITSHANSSNDHYNLNRVYLPSEVPIVGQSSVNTSHFMLCWHSSAYDQEINNSFNKR